MKKLIMIILLFIAPCYAVQDYYQFNTPNDQQRFDSMTKNLRCLVCQNQTIADSNATLAGDLREQVYQQIRQGQSDKEIVDYLVGRYGNYILYTPPFNAKTLALWIGPFFILIMGLGYLFYYIRKKA